MKETWACESPVAVVMSLLRKNEMTLNEECELWGKQDVQKNNRCST